MRAAEAQGLVGADRAVQRRPGARARPARGPAHADGRRHPVQRARPRATRTTTCSPASRPRWCCSASASSTGPKDHVTMRNVEGSQAATEHLLGHRPAAPVVAFGADPGEVIGSAGPPARGLPRRRSRRPGSPTTRTSSSTSSAGTAAPARRRCAACWSAACPSTASSPSTT